MFWEQWYVNIQLQYVIFRFIVGEEEEISIKDAVEMIVDAMKFTGPVTVSFAKV